MTGQRGWDRNVATLENGTPQWRVHTIPVAGRPAGLDIYPFQNPIFPARAICTESFSKYRLATTDFVQIGARGLTPNAVLFRPRPFGISESIYRPILQSLYPLPVIGLPRILA